MKSLELLRANIEAHRKEFHKRKAFPGELWEEIVKLAEEFPPATIAKELGISSGNLARQLKKRKNSIPLKQDNKVSMVELNPSMLSMGAKKQMTVELSNHIILRIDL